MESTDEARDPGRHHDVRAGRDGGGLPAAFAGIAVLFLVNLIELGCALGLPAIYTRIVTLRDQSGPARYGLLALSNNVAYVGPLATIVLVYTLTLHRLVLAAHGLATMLPFTYEPVRVALLHRNIQKLATITITNTLSKACKVTGTIGGS